MWDIVVCDKIKIPYLIK